MREATPSLTFLVSFNLLRTNSQFINDCERNMKQLRIILLVVCVLIANTLSEGIE